jgi:hypothetical protein
LRGGDSEFGHMRFQMGVSGASPGALARRL